MDQLRTYLDRLAALDLNKAVISKPFSKSREVKKIVIEPRAGRYQCSKYTDKQVFHENVDPAALADTLEALMAGGYGQLNAWDGSAEYMLLVSAKGKCTFKRLVSKQPSAPAPQKSHDRKKQYILEASADIAPLVDMGVFTKEGKVVASMYDKYRQINRYIEIIDDAVKDLDLKADVIEKCNEAARRYGYENLRFELGDINGYAAPFDVDLVMTLHACDVATDFALYNAITWGARMIFSVPCCQHELNGQIQTDELGLLTRYGILQERFSALCTDAIRGNLLEYCGYKTQLLEFIDFAHTPKNILIRSVRRRHTPQSHKELMLRQVEALMAQFHFQPTLYKLLFQEGFAQAEHGPSPIYCDTPDFL